MCGSFDSAHIRGVWRGAHNQSLSRFLSYILCISFSRFLLRRVSECALLVHVSNNAFRWISSLERFRSVATWDGDGNTFSDNGNNGKAENDKEKGSIDTVSWRGANMEAHRGYDATFMLKDTRQSRILQDERNHGHVRFKPISSECSPLRISGRFHPGDGGRRCGQLEVERDFAEYARFS